MYPLKTDSLSFQHSSIGNFSLHPTVIVNFNHNSLESRLSDSRNDLTFGYLDAGIGAELVYSIRKLHVSLMLPLKYKWFSLDNHRESVVTDKNRFRVEP